MAKPPQIRKVGDSKFIKLLVYGVPSVGKTRLVGSGGPNVLIVRPPIDHTNAIVTMQPDEKLRPEEWVVHDWDDMDQVMEYLRAEGGKHSWVWLDSLSGWQDVGLDDIWQATVDAKPHRASKDPTGGLDKGEYGRNMERIERWVRHVSGLDSFNFGITAWPFQQTKYANPEGIYTTMPWVQGKEMANKICGYMTIVAYMEVKKTKEGKAFRVLRTKLTEDYYAKDQYDAFGEDGNLYHPTLPKIEAAINAARGRKASGPSGVRKAARRPSAASAGQGSRARAA